MKTPPLIAHWPLRGNAQDAGGRHHGSARGVAWTTGPDGGADGGAQFNGRDSLIEVADAPELQLGGEDFSVSAWIKCARPMRGVFGGVLSKFDGERRCGLNLWVAGSSASYSAMGDSRHVHAGIDDAYCGEWKDHGRPGVGNPLVPCLTVYQGELYAGVSDAERPEEACKVFRWAGGEEWVDCGRLGGDPSHLSVMSMIVHEGHLYAGTGIWDWGRAEEARRASPPNALTHVFRYEGGTTWRDLGQVGSAQRVICMASFGGELYAGLDRGDEGRCFKLRGDRWIDAGVLEDRDNFECLMPLGGVLYGASHFAVYRYDGDRTWTCIGRRPFDITQIHSLQVFGGKLWAGTWPQGYVLRYEGGEEWTNTGLLGLAAGRPGVAMINEINALGVHNGKLFAGVLPKAQIYRYEADGQWTLLGNFASRGDWNPADCPSWMRVLTLTTHKGSLFTCTGASQARARDVDPDLTVGRVLSCQTGVVASHEQDIGGEWTHVAAVRRSRDLRLYINGVLSHRMAAPRRRHFDLGNAEPLWIGAGSQGNFDGAISDVRIYRGALGTSQVKRLQRQRGGEDA
jgi:hypothetical protein